MTSHFVEPHGFPNLYLSVILVSFSEVVKQMPSEEIDSLHLPAPETFAAFPYQPYDIQLELMKSLYAALEDRKVAILESPTGTVCHSVLI